MINGKQNKRALIEGRAALIVIDIQQSTFVEKDVRSIPHMADYAERMARSRAMEYLQAGAIRQMDEVMSAMSANLAAE